MIRSLFETRLPPAAEARDLDAVMSLRRSLWQTQAAAMEKLPAAGTAPFRSIISSLLSGRNNCVFSPSTVYTALLFLSGLCSAAAGQELLQALSCRDALTAYRAVRDSVTGDALVSAHSLSHSLWLSQRLPIQRETLRAHCRQYGADAYCGDMGSQEMDAAVCAWLDAHTGAQLTQHTARRQTTPDVAMELLSASCFKAEWMQRFCGEETRPGAFYIDPQTSVTCDFMNQEEQTRGIRGRQFAAVVKPLQQDYRMWFVRPNDGVQLQQLVENETVRRLLTAPSKLPTEALTVTMHIPRFDVSSRLDLRAAMEAMGIRAVFDGAALPFAAVSRETQLFLGKAAHTARVKLTEEGVEAASFVESRACSGRPRTDKLDFRLDRPFLFAITKSDRLPLYVGAVVDPRNGTDEG